MNPCLTIRKAIPRGFKQTEMLLQKATSLVGDYTFGKGNQEKFIGILKKLFNVDANRTVIKEY